MGNRPRGLGIGIGLVLLLVGLLLLGRIFFAQSADTPLSAAPTQLAPAATANLEQQAAASPAAAAPDAGAPAAGTVVIEDRQVNEYIQANPQALGPLESVTVAFTPGLVTAELRALGTTSTASSGLSVVDGTIVPVNPQISGTLGKLVSAESIARQLAEQINRQLTEQGRRARELTIEQGRLVILVE